METSASHYCEIRANRSSLLLDWREIWRYRDLLILLVRRDFVSKYKQTVLGPLWFIIQPVIMTVVFTLVFNRLADLPTNDVPPMLFYFCGLLGWNYFSQSFNGIASTFTGHANLFSKVYFPRMVIPLSCLFSNLIAFVIQLGCFVLIYAYLKMFSPSGGTFGFTMGIFLFPLVLLQAGLFALGVGLWLTSLTAKYRDLVHILQFLTQIWLYATPVIYPISKIPADWHWLFALNPMASVVESFRIIFLGAGNLTPGMLMTSIAVTLLVLISGMVFFNRIQRTFIDTV